MKHSELTSPYEYIKKKRWLEIKFIIYSIIGKKMHFLRSRNVFGYLGRNVLYQPYRLPRNPRLVKIHNNVKIAAGVTFYEHDVINSMLKNVDMSLKGSWKIHQTPIEIFDNCFIGGGAMLIGDIKIGPNAIVAAGSVVTKDVEPGTIVGGNPAKVIGSFDSLYEKRLKNDYSETDMLYSISDEEIWECYYEKYKQSTKG